jgi:uncharacterized protein (TIGR02453 family)
LIAEIPAFGGYKDDTFNFLEELSKNNSLQWFAENRERYNNSIVLPSKSLILALAPFFNQLEPKINTEPKFDKTLMRINRDYRFSNGAPYRDYFLVHFRRFKDDSEFYVYISKDGIEYGLYVNNALGNELFFNKNLPGHRDELIETFKRFELNGKFDFYEMNKSKVELVKKSFNIEEDFDKMARTKDILLQKEMNKSSEIIYTSDILLEIIKTFSQLYTIYCFCISLNPLPLIETFENQIGIIK